MRRVRVHLGDDSFDGKFLQFVGVYGRVAVIIEDSDGFIGEHTLDEIQFLDSSRETRTNPDWLEDGKCDQKT